MNYQILTGEIIAGNLYNVLGSIIYNSTNVTNMRFKGILGFPNFTGAGIVTEVSELKGNGIEVLENSIDNPVFPESTLLSDMAAELDLNSAEIIVNDPTKY